jgi:hypothetical protein
MSSMKLELKAISQHDVDLTFSGSEGGSEVDEEEVNDGGHEAAGSDGNESDRSSLPFNEEEMERAFRAGGAQGPYDESEAEEGEEGGNYDEESKEDKASSKKKKTGGGEYAGVTGDDDTSEDDEKAEAAAKANAKKRGRGGRTAAPAAPKNKRGRNKA